VTFNCSNGKSKEFQTALAFAINKINLQNVQFLMPNNFRKYPLKQEQFKDFRALLYELKDFQGMDFLFPNSSRTFKDLQVLYEPCFIFLDTSAMRLHAG
jgi:hypothetical protein